MVGKRIAIFRKKNEWTQNELARAARLSRSYIAAIEEGKEPGVKAIVQIAEALGVKVEDLLKGSD
jgi:transcriptional regulator with XRE-family HTH domain